MRNLAEKELKELFEKSRISQRRRIVKSFQEESYPGPQLGLNIIQPDSYVRPHLRYTDEHIMHHSGKLCSIVFDEEGMVQMGQIISRETPYMFLPSKTYHTVVSLEEDSAIWFITQGPFNPNRFSEFLSNTPSEKENYKDYFDFLKKMEQIAD